MTVTERETELINLKETRKKKIWDKKEAVANQDGPSGKRTAFPGHPVHTAFSESVIAVRRRARRRLESDLSSADRPLVPAFARLRQFRANGSANAIEHSETSLKIIVRSQMYEKLSSSHRPPCYSTLTLCTRNARAGCARFNRARGDRYSERCNCVSSTTTCRSLDHNVSKKERGVARPLR